MFFAKHALNDEKLTKVLYETQVATKESFVGIFTFLAHLRHGQFVRLNFFARFASTIGLLDERVTASVTP